MPQQKKTQNTGGPVQCPQPKKLRLKKKDPSFMEKKPPEKSFQTKILKMAVKSDQVGIERKSNMQNFCLGQK